MRPAHDGRSSEICVRLAGLIAACLIFAVLFLNVLRLEDALRPRTGDLIAFIPTRDALQWVETVTAIPIGTAADVRCSLDPQVMEASGGSLVIEATQFTPRLSYRVHWAGVRTSDTGTDCGRSADLQLNPADILTLSLAAGHRG